MSTTVPAFSPISGASLYVGDLDIKVTEEQLSLLFSQMGHVHSVKVCKNRMGRAGYAHAYVNFETPMAAQNAMKKLNFTPINGKPIRLMFEQKHPTVHGNSYANVFIKNLKKNIGSKDLYHIFSELGHVLSCKVATDSKGKSKGYGFVQFEDEKDADYAISTLNGMCFNDQKVYVGHFIPRGQREQEIGTRVFKSVYVKNLPNTFTESDLINVFKECGQISSAVVMKNENVKSKCFGFVNYVNTEDAARAVDKFNGYHHNNMVWYVGRVKSKSERDDELKANFETKRVNRFQEIQGSNLYLKNLDLSYDDEKLRQLFSQFGTITSCKVAVDPKGQSKGFGFVAFSSREEANSALSGMNKKMVGSKRLYVAFAESKSARNLKLQAHFARINAQRGMPPAYPFTSGHVRAPGFNPNFIVQGQPGQFFQRNYRPMAHPQASMYPPMTPSMTLPKYCSRMPSTSWRHPGSHQQWPMY